jgi:apolipoprotein N-acyltransferase
MHQHPALSRSYGEAGERLVVTMSLPVAILLAFASGILLPLSFPRNDIEAIAWVALVPLLLAIRGATIKRACALSFLAAQVFFMGVFYWINTIGGFKWFDFMLSGIYLSAYVALFGAAIALISRYTTMTPLATIPVVWVACEYVRSHFLFINLPWALLGHSQYLNIPIIQVATVAGVYGVSFLIVLANTAFVLIIEEWQKSANSTSVISRYRSGLLGLLIVGGCYGVGAVFLAIEQPADRRLTIAVIQPNIPQRLKWDPDYRWKHLEEQVQLSTKAASEGRPRLIVWPEAALPDSLYKNVSLAKAIAKLAQETDSYLIIGGATRPKFGTESIQSTRWVNSAFLISPRGAVEQQYDKIVLLPFAEYLPYRNAFPWPHRFIRNVGSFIPGAKHTIFEADDTRFAVTICWENIFPEHVNTFVRNGAEFIVNMANEAWFDDTAAPYQFLSMSVFRAVENRRAVIRSSNTGISGVIDPYGRIIERVSSANKDVFVAGYAIAPVPVLDTMTFYALHGDVFGRLSVGAAIVLLLLAALWRYHSSHGYGIVLDPAAGHKSSPL